MDLNNEQKKAVSVKAGPAVVLAGPGSGKTAVITRRTIKLIREEGIPSGNILVVTFTRAAAEEMKRRLLKEAENEEEKQVTFGTFHSIFFKILRFAYNLDGSCVIRESDAVRELSRLAFELGLRIESTDLIPEILGEIGKVKGSGLGPKEYAPATVDAETFWKMYAGYADILRKNRLVDFEDMMLMTEALFDTRPDVLDIWREKFRYIMIDEFQDIDMIQYEMMKALCPYHNNLFVVGDPDQTIYTWRGADIRYLLEFDKNFPGVRTIMMNRNYRSTAEILHVANSLISKNQNRMKKTLIPGREMPPAVEPTYYHALSAEDEAEWIENKIRELSAQYKLSDIAILYRAHYLSRPIEEVFQREKIPYTLNSGVPFFDRAEIKDSLSYLRMIAYKDDLSFLRIVNTPKRNIGERRIKFLQEFVATNGGSLYEALKLCAGDELFANTKAREFIDLIEGFAATYSGMQISELFSHVMNKSSYEKQLRTEGSQERLDNLAELKQSIYEYETSCGEECTLENYLAHAALYTNADIQSSKNAVRLMTVHTAKGLEFPVVFIVGLNENIFPSKKTDSLKAMEEERRLAFVAVTRAQEQLFLTEAEGFSQAAGGRYPSRFIFDIERPLLNYVAELPPQLLAKSRAYIDERTSILQKKSALADLQPGDTVEHNILGRGKVVSVDHTAATYTIQFDTMSTPRKMSFRAPLKKH